MNMFDLLPEKERELIKSEYKIRRWSLLLIFLFFLGVISVILFTPTYFAIYLEKRYLSEALDEVQRESEKLVDPKMFEELKRVNETVNSLESHLYEISVTELMKGVLSCKPDGVSITSFAFEKTDGGGSLRTSLAGHAGTREELLEFSSNLKEEDYVTEVDIPLASFAREYDLDFSLQIKGDL